MKVFFILFLLYFNLIGLSNELCNKRNKNDCPKTTTPVSSESEESEELSDNTNKDKDKEIKEQPSGSTKSKFDPIPVVIPTSKDKSIAKEFEITEENSNAENSESSSLPEESSTAVIDADAANKQQVIKAKKRWVEKLTQVTTPPPPPPKSKGFFSSLASAFTKSKDPPSINDKNQEQFLQKYYKLLQEKGLFGFKKDSDVNLKEFKGASSGSGDQSDKEQRETDGFFNQFKNYLGKTCFQNIGCFSATEYNDFANRPIPMLPMSPESIAPVFHMYTLESRSVPRNYSYNASRTQLKYSTFNPKLRTAFIVHGYQSGYALWMEDYIFYRSDDSFNVVVVVWEKGSKVAMYNLAATNTRVVGACIGFFIETLCKTFNITNDRFYLIGHSLGGHTIGYAGKRLINPKVARLIALDPAGVGFHFPSPTMRLDSTDATLVMAIHTDGALIFSEGFGTQDTLGHYDFYPNGGTWQPGCPESNSVAQKLGSITSGKDITCSHSRACLIISNLDKPEDNCQAVAYSCMSYEMFLEGRCADCRENRCELMGINPNYWLTHEPNNKTINKKYYINTSHKEEYCLQHYQFAFHVTNDSDSTTGVLHIQMKMSVNNETKEMLIHRLMSKTTQKKIHTLLVNFDFKIDKIFEIELQWKRYNSAVERMRVNRGFKFKIPIIEINYMSKIDAKEREKYSSILCASNPNIIVNKGRTVYKECKLDLKDSGLTVDPEKMAAMEWRGDIYAVDYKREHKVFHKIPGTRIKETIDKFAKVN